MRPKSEMVKAVTLLPRPMLTMRPSKYSKAAPSWVRSLRVLHRLVVVRVEAAELDVEDLPRDAELGAAGDDAGDGLQGCGQRIVDELVRHGIEILRRIGDAADAGRSHGGGQRGLGLDGALDDDLVLLGEEIGLVGGEDGVERVGGGRRAEGRLREPVDGNGAGGRDVELERSLPGEEERVAGGGDAGEHGVGIHVHGFDGVGDGAAPADALAAAEIGGDGLPRGGLIEVREQRIGQRNGVGVDLRFGGGSDQRAGVGDDGGAAGVEEVLHAGERGIEREGAAGLRSLESDGQQFAHGIGEAGRAGARRGECGKGVGIGGDHGAVAVVAALQVDADQGAIVGAAGSLRHGGKRVELEKKRAHVEAGHGGHGGRAEKLPAGLVAFALMAGSYCCAAKSGDATVR